MIKQAIKYLLPENGDNGNKVAIVIISIVISYLFALIVLNHYSANNLQTQHIAQFKQDAAKRAATVEYFFYERKDDLLNLTLLRELSAYFENKALGMSMEYGLNLSLLPIKERFNDLINRKQMRSDRIYLRIALIQDDGVLLVDSNTNSNNRIMYDWKQFIAPELKRGGIIDSGEKNVIIVSTTYFFKDKYAGQLIAWIDADNIYKHLLQKEDGDNLTFIFSEQLKSFTLESLLPSSFSDKFPAIRSARTGEPTELKAKSHGNNMIFISLAIPQTPFSLIRIVKADQIFGKLSLWLLDFGLLVIAVIILGGSYIFLMSNIKSIVLKTQLLESRDKEKAISIKNQELEAEINERKKIETELRIAKEVAESATVAKSEFLANMSHEIRTPMNSILGFLDIVLEDQSIKEEHRQQLSIAHGSAKGLLSLINAILDMSKLESGKGMVTHEQFSLVRLIEQIMEMMYAKADEKGIELKYHIDESLSKSLFSGDPIKTRQVIINLLGNAIKFTHKGWVTLKIIPEGNKPDMVHFIIEDTGIGIAPDHLSHIFEPFTQADSSTTRKYGGTGLGTTISRQIVEFLGGQIWVESEEGNGSIFHFILPIEKIEQPIGQESVEASECIEKKSEKADIYFKHANMENIAKTNEIITRLQACIAQYSPDGIEPLIEQLQHYISSEHLKPIIKYINDFDFSSAENELNMIISKLGDVQDK